MRTSKFTVSQILAILKKYESGQTAKELTQKYGFHYQIREERSFSLDRYRSQDCRYFGCFFCNLYNEMTPSVDTAKKLSELLGSTVGYLLGETDNANLFKDPAMLQRLSDLENMHNEDKTHILHVLDNFIKAVKLKNIAAL